MKSQQLNELHTRLGKITASQSSSRLSKLPALIDDKTAKPAARTALVDDWSPVNAVQSAPHGVSGMVELRPIPTSGEPPVTAMGASLQGQGVPLSQSALLQTTLNPSAQSVAHPWRPTAATPASQTTQLMTPPVPATASPDWVERQMQEMLERLQDRAEQMTPFSDHPETALREFQTLARDLKATGRENNVFVEIDDLLDWSNLASQTPRVERNGTRSFLITTQMSDLRRARYDAETNAETVRRLQGVTQRSRLRQRGASPQLRQVVSLAGWVWKQVLGLVEPGLTKPSRRVASRAAQPVAEPTISVQSSLIWVGGAIVVRLGLDLMLAANPSLWLVAIAVIAAPAVIALLRITRSPQSGFAMGVNLFLIMIGLLVGGRF